MDHFHHVTSKDAAPFELAFPEFPEGKMRTFADIDELNAFVKRWSRRLPWYAMGRYLVYDKTIFVDRRKLRISDPRLTLICAGEKPRRD